MAAPSNQVPLSAWSWVNDRDLWFPVIPGYAELIPGSPEKLPGSLATGISFQPVDSAHVFLRESTPSRPNPKIPG
jgi:hypothetical protein